MEKEPNFMLEKPKEPQSLFEKLEKLNSLSPDEKLKARQEMSELKDKLYELIDELEIPARTLNGQIEAIDDELGFTDDPDDVLEDSLDSMKKAMEKIMDIYPKLFK